MSTYCTETEEPPKYWEWKRKSAVSMQVFPLRETEAQELEDRPAL